MLDQGTLNHLVAGGIGGTTGAILTCPLEVVKTRLQSSNSGFDVPATTTPIVNRSGSKSTNNNGNKSKKTKLNWHRLERVTLRPVFGSQYSSVHLLLRSGNGYNFGSATPILYSTQSQPCRPIKTKLSSFPDRAGGKHLLHSSVSTSTASIRSIHTIPTAAMRRCVHTISMPENGPAKPVRIEVWRCLRHIRNHEGTRGLFRGLGPNLVGVLPHRSIYFWSYQTTKQTLNRNLPMENRDTPFVHVQSAFCAGFFSSCVTSPIWVIKTRLQLDRSEGGLISVIKKIHSEKGILGFWKGLTASWWGISETIIHLVIYEYLKKLYQNQQKKDNQDHSLIDNFALSMVCGATSKTCAILCTYPHEVARTRMREAGTKYKSFWPTLFLVGREEGHRGLYRGLTTQLVRSMPNMAIVMATYELIVHMLENYQRERRNKAVMNSTISNKSSE